MAVRSPFPNWEYYPLLLIGAGGWVVLGLPPLGGLGLWRHRAERTARLAAWVVVSSLAVYLVYYFQSARFMLPAACVLVVYAGVAVSDIVLAARTPKHDRPPAAEGSRRLPPSSSRGSLRADPEPQNRRGCWYPEKAGTRYRTRTCDQGIKSPLLYQLS